MPRLLALPALALLVLPLASCEQPASIDQALDTVQLSVTGQEEEELYRSCGVGFWKQPAHFVFWPEGVEPAVGFCTLFDLDPRACVARLNVPGGGRTTKKAGTVGSLTARDALELRGGGLNALVRHTMAGILNLEHEELLTSESGVSEESAIGTLRAVNNAQGLFQQRDPDDEEAGGYAESLEELQDCELVDDVDEEGQEQRARCMCTLKEDDAEG